MSENLQISCDEDDFLTRNPCYETSHNTFNTPEGALIGLNSIYNILQTQEKVEKFEMAGAYCSPDIFSTRTGII